MLLNNSAGICKYYDDMAWHLETNVQLHLESVIQDKFWQDLKTYIIKFVSVSEIYHVIQEPRFTFRWRKCGPNLVIWKLFGNIQALSCSCQAYSTGLGTFCGFPPFQHLRFWQESFGHECFIMETKLRHMPKCFGDKISVPKCLLQKCQVPK